MEAEGHTPFDVVSPGVPVAALLVASAHLEDGEETTFKSKRNSGREFQGLEASLTSAFIKVFDISTGSA